LDCAQGDIQTIGLQCLFGGVIGLFYVISYQVTDQGIADTFANANRRVHPRGIFLLDVWHAPAVLTQGLSARVKRAEDEKVRITRTAAPQIDIDSKVATVRYSVRIESKINNRIQTFQENRHMRYFVPAEIDEFAKHSGFEIEYNEEFVTGNLPSENTWGVCYLLRKQT